MYVHIIKDISIQVIHTLDLYRPPTSSACSGKATELCIYTYVFIVAIAYNLLYYCQLPSQWKYKCNTSYNHGRAH